MRSYGGSSVTSSPKNRTRPDVAGKSPVTTLNSVVLPAPLAPITARRSPAATANETSSSARNAPKYRETPSSSRAFPVAIGTSACGRSAVTVAMAQADSSPPRKRGPSDFERHWIPAFAGMTTVVHHGQSGTSREPILKSALDMPSIWLTLSIFFTTLL